MAISNPTEYFNRFNKKIKLRSRAPNHSTPDEKRSFKKALTKLKSMYGNGSYYVLGGVETPPHEMSNVDFPLLLHLSRTKNGKIIKDEQGNPRAFNGKFFIKF